MNGLKPPYWSRDRLRRAIDVLVYVIALMPTTVMIFSNLKGAGIM